MHGILLERSSLGTSFFLAKKVYSAEVTWSVVVVVVEAWAPKGLPEVNVVIAGPLWLILPQMHTYIKIKNWVLWYKLAPEMNIDNQTLRLHQKQSQT